MTRPDSVPTLPDLQLILAMLSHDFQEDHERAQRSPPKGWPGSGALNIKFVFLVSEVGKVPDSCKRLAKALDFLKV